jgi:hypothetical protein
LLYNRSGHPQEITPCLCCTYAAARSAEHGHPDAFFELPNAAAQRRLPQNWRFSVPSKAPVISGCHGISEVLHIDR